MGYTAFSISVHRNVNDIGRHWRNTVAVIDCRCPCKVRTGLNRSYDMPVLQIVATDNYHSIIDIMTYTVNLL